MTWRVNLIEIFETFTIPKPYVTKQANLSCPLLIQQQMSKSDNNERATLYVDEPSQIKKRLELRLQIREAK